MRIFVGVVAVGVLVALPGASASAAPVLFENPRGDIGCAISASGVRCDIRAHDWDPPPKPDWCSVDWGNGLEVGRRGRAHFTCAGDTVLGGNRTVGWGKSIRRGRFRCTVRRDGVRCVNLRNEHGFKLGRRLARWF